MEPTRGMSQSTQWHVDRWRQGDRDALGRLCLRFSPLIRSRLRGSRAWPGLAGHMTMDDAEQEVWARILQTGPEGFRTDSGGGRFVAWLGTLVDSTTVDLLRRAQAKKRGGGRDPELLDSLVEAQKLRRPGQASILGPSGEARMAEFKRVAGQTLSERELKAWRWVVLQDYTSEEAALGLDCTSAAVRGLLLRSREKLRDALRRSAASGERPPSR